MKQRLLLSGLVLLLLLSGCTSMLERSSASVQPFHQSVNRQDGSALEAQTYQQLVSSVLYLVTQHSEQGIIRLYNYTGDVESDVTRACLEVVQKDPLGAFAVDYIKHDVERIVSFHEATIEISYLRTAEEMKQITAVTGSSAIKQELRETLSRLENKLLLRISYYSEEERYLTNLIYQAYYDSPLSAFGLPQVAISLYPASGIQRIVEIDLAYPTELQTLQTQREALEQAAVRLLSDCPESQAHSLYELLLRHTAYSSDGSSAYAALVDGSSNAEGLALAYKLLCDQAGINCTVVRGEGRKTFWNIVATANGSRHVDCSSGLFGLTDHQLQQLDGGYLWDDSYPICRDGKELQAE